MQVEIRRLNILVAQGCRRVSYLKAEIKYIETLEAQRVKQIRILKSVQVRNAALCLEIKSRKAALAEPLSVEPLPVKPEFSQDIDCAENPSSKAPGNSKTNPVDPSHCIPGPFSAGNRSGTPGRAPRTPGSPAKSRELSVDPNTVFADTQAYAMFAKFTNNAFSHSG